MTWYGTTVPTPAAKPPSYSWENNGLVVGVLAFWRPQWTDFWSDRTSSAIADSKMREVLRSGDESWDHWPKSGRSLSSNFGASIIRGNRGARRAARAEVARIRASARRPSGRVFEAPEHSDPSPQPWTQGQETMAPLVAKSSAAIGSRDHGEVKPTTRLISRA